MKTPLIAAVSFLSAFGSENEPPEAPPPETDPPQIISVELVAPGEISIRGKHLSTPNGVCEIFVVHDFGIAGLLPVEKVDDDELRAFLRIRDLQEIVLVPVRPEPASELVVGDGFRESGRPNPLMPKPPASGPGSFINGEVPPTGGRPRFSSLPRARTPLEFRFRGPGRVETSDPSTDGLSNPFTDFHLRLDLWNDQGNAFWIRGFFNGDGRGGESGDVWCFRFLAPEPGLWFYRVHMREGPDAGIDPSDPPPGTPTGFDGLTGSFIVGSVDENAPSFYRYGPGEPFSHYGKFRHGPLAIKIQATVPENLFCYEDFDQTTSMGGDYPTFVHAYAPHVEDWMPGDPTWDGDSGTDLGKGLIGAINYLSSQGVNQLYILPMNRGGDGDDTWPFVSPDPTVFAKTHYDLSKLHQWFTVLEHAARRGVWIQFVMMETDPENEQYLDGGVIGRERKLYYHQILTRFGQWLPGIEVNHCEECDLTSLMIDEVARYTVDLVDPRYRTISQGVHSFPNDNGGLLDRILNIPEITSFYFQWHGAVPGNTSYLTELARNYMGRADTQVGLQEAIDMIVRRNSRFSAASLVNQNWIGLASGADEVGLYTGNDIVGGDVTLEDFRDFSYFWEFMGNAPIALSELPLESMEAHDALLTGEMWDLGQVLAELGEHYLVYMPDASIGGILDLQDGSPTETFRVRWFDPHTGLFDLNKDFVPGGGQVILEARTSPDAVGWVVLVQKI